MTTAPTAEQLKGSIRRQFGYLLDHTLTADEVEFLGENTEVVLRVFNVLVSGMRDLCPSCVSTMGLMTEKDDLTLDEKAEAVLACQCGEISSVLGTDEEEPSP